MTTPTVERTTGWTADAATFGARLALVRQRMSWGNVKEAAVACGLPPESWRTWERDGVEPRRIVNVAKQISGVVGCDYIWLLAGPDGGGAETTRQYHPEAHVVATIGEPRTSSRARPVRRTQPTGHPMTPVAA